MSQLETRIKTGQQPKQTSTSSMSGLQKILDVFETLEINPIADPGFTPKGSSLGQQIKIVVDSISSPTSRRLYMYSFKTKEWMYIALSV